MSIRQLKFSDLFGFSRKGEASFFQDNSIAFAEYNEVREIYDNGRMGIIIESASFNYLSNSFSPRKQTVFLNAGVYTLSSLGGTVIDIEDEVITQLSPFTFTVAGDETPVTITPREGTTVFQLESGMVASSFIRTPENEGAGRERDIIWTDRSKSFSRNSGTIIGQFHVPQVEPNTVYLDIEDDSDIISQFKSDENGNLSFVHNGDPITFLNELPEDGIMKYAIVYDAFQKYIRCYFNEEVGELSLGSYFTPQSVSFTPKEGQASRMILSRYEYRPKALTNREVGRIFDFEFELAYDFEVTPQQVSNWATLIFAASGYGFL